MVIELWPGWYGLGLFRAENFRRLMLGYVTISWFKKSRLASMTPVEEMKAAADLISRGDHIGVCAGGFPIIMSEEECRFCGATWKDKCRRNPEDARPHD